MIQHRSFFKVDLEGYYYRSFGTTTPPFHRKLYLWIYQFGLHCMAVYRLGQYVKMLRRRNRLAGMFLQPIHRVLDFFMKMVHHVGIDAAEIGPGLYIGHVGTIYIGPSVIGENFCVTHNVTIGVGHTMDTEDVPRIGNDVWVGTGSVITGSISIGDRVAVSSGSILSRDVPDGCLVGGNPARVILKDFDNSTLIGKQPRSKAEAF